MKLILGEVIMDEEILSVKKQNIKDIENFEKSKKITNTDTSLPILLIIP